MTDEREREDLPTDYETGYADGFRDACRIFITLAENGASLAESHAARAEIERKREGKEC